MKAVLLIVMLAVGFMSKAQEFERKVIIKDGVFHYVSVDDNLQIGTPMNLLLLFFYHYTRFI